MTDITDLTEQLSNIVRRGDSPAFDKDDADLILRTIIRRLTNRATADQIDLDFNTITRRFHKQLTD